jgi:hypothetical protein
MSSLQVSSLPKVQKMESIKSYLQTQASFAKYYAEEGRAVVHSWNSLGSSVGGPNASSKADQLGNFGFTTPVLKPRVSRLTENGSKGEQGRSSLTKPTDGKENSLSLKPCNKSSRQILETEVVIQKPDAPKRQKKTTNKRPITASSECDDEHIASNFSRQ